MPGGHPNSHPLQMFRSRMPHRNGSRIVQNKNNSHAKGYKIKKYKMGYLGGTRRRKLQDRYKLCKKRATPPGVTLSKTIDLQGFLLPEIPLQQAGEGLDVMF